MSDAVKVENLRFVCVYVDDLDTNKAFYEKYLGFKQTDEFRPGEIFGELGDVHMWMGQGYQKSAGDETHTRMTVMLGVNSVGTLFNALSADKHKVLQDAPVEMQPGTYWLQFVDPSGNVVEVLGGK